MAVADDILKLIIGPTKKAAGATERAARRITESAKPKTIKDLPRLPPGEFVRDRQRTAFPGIYRRPDEIARDAAANTVAEDPALKYLFGVDRNDLFEMSRQTRANPSIVRLPENPRGAQSAANIITPKNTQRMLDTLAEAQRYPELYQGMMAWYNMDPAADVLRRISNDPQRDFMRFNTFSGMASPGSDVITELQRGAAARYLDEQGLFDLFEKYGGRPSQPGAPAEISHVPGHPYSSTSHALPMGQYARTGEIGIKAPKVPPYIQSSMPTEYGGTWTVPVGDAHFSRAVGLADTRKGQDFGSSVSTPELQTLMPWWSGISRELGMQEVPAQALTWGTFARETGVETPVGAPKLELLAGAIMRRAQQLGVDPKMVRDAVLTGRMPLATGATAAGAGLLGSMGSDKERAY